MKPGLTKREKILLFSVGLLIIFYVSFQFGIMPLSARYNDGVSSRDQLSNEKTAHDMEVVLLPSLRDRNEEAHTKYNALRDEYRVLGPNEDIINMLTDLCNQNSLKPTQMNISKPDTPPPPPPAPPEDIRYNDDGEPIENEETPEAPPPPVFTKISAQVTVTGNYQSLMRLLEDVSASNYIYLSNVSFTESRQEGYEGVANISLAFEITYLTV